VLELALLCNELRSALLSTGFPLLDWLKVRVGSYAMCMHSAWRRTPCALRCNPSAVSYSQVTCPPQLTANLLHLNWRICATLLMLFLLSLWGGACKQAASVLLYPGKCNSRATSSRVLRSRRASDTHRH
jgi:hypothetical protein